MSFPLIDPALCFDSISVVSPLLQSCEQHFRKAIVMSYLHGCRLVFTRLLPHSSLFNFLIQTPYLVLAAFPPFLLALSPLELQPFPSLSGMTAPFSLPPLGSLKLVIFFQPCQASSSFPQLYVSFPSTHSFISRYPSEFALLHLCLLPQQVFDPGPYFNRNALLSSVLLLLQCDLW